ncbi:MAG: YdcF family protein [Syntrophaceae bacterium]
MTEGMKSLLHWVMKTVVAVIFMVLVLLCLGIFTGLGQDFLRGTATPFIQSVDAVVVLAGGPQHDKQRLARGITLVRQGRAHYLILPLRVPAIDWQNLQKLYALNSGIPPDRVLIGRPIRTHTRLTAMSGGTFAEALNTAEIMRGHGLHSALVVSSDYHMRRVQLAFNRVVPDGSLVLAFEPVLTRQPVGVISRFKSHSAILLEYGKLAAAWCVYPAREILRL